MDSEEGLKEEDGKESRAMVERQGQLIFFCSSFVCLILLKICNEKK
jgi:hypothetical protein